MGRPIVEENYEERKDAQLISEDPVKADEAFKAMVGPEKYQTA